MVDSRTASGDRTAQLRAMAHWWADVIRAPKMDNGDRSEVGGMTMMMATLLSAKSAPTDEQCRKFEDALFSGLCAAKWNAWERPECRVDYHPDQLLAVAARESGVSANVFPWKTATWIDDDGRVLARYGYGAPVEEIPLSAPVPECESK